MTYLMRAQVVLPFLTGDPSDVITNSTIHEIDDAIEPATAATTVGQKVAAFYDTVYGTAGTNRVNYIQWGNAVVKCYDLRDATPRPLYEYDMGYSAGTRATSIPTEVACVVSFRAAQQPGVPYQSMYNRFYLGGMHEAWFSDSTTAFFPRFNSTLMNACNSAMETLATNATFGTICRQFGKTAEGPRAAREIVEGFTDNAPDTQRRRSVGSSDRIIWSIND